MFHIYSYIECANTVWGERMPFDVVLFARALEPRGASCSSVERGHRGTMSCRASFLSLHCLFSRVSVAAGTCLMIIRWILYVLAVYMCSKHSRRAVLGCARAYVRTDVDVDGAAPLAFARRTLHAAETRRTLSWL